MGFGALHLGGGHTQQVRGRKLLNSIQSYCQLKQVTGQRVDQPVRHVSALLAMYILLLTAVPCSDLGAQTDARAGDELAQVHGEDSGDEPHEGHDECSAFCACACCGVSMVEPGTAFRATPPRRLEISRANPSLPPARLLGILGAAPWQPPRV